MGPRLLNLLISCLDAKEVCKMHFEPETECQCQCQWIENIDRSLSFAVRAGKRGAREK
jgi:hypothetical protein